MRNVNIDRIDERQSVLFGLFVVGCGIGIGYLLFYYFAPALQNLNMYIQGMMETVKWTEGMKW